MELIRGNRAIRDHAHNGRDLHLFEQAPPAHLRYRGQFVCSGYKFVDNMPDAEGSPRRAIAFELVPLKEDELDENLADVDVAGLSLQQLREAALQPPAVPAGSSDAKRNAYRRSAAVRAYTLAR